LSGCDERRMVVNRRSLGHRSGDCLSIALQKVYLLSFSHKLSQLVFVSLSTLRKILFELCYLRHVLLKLCCEFRRWWILILSPKLLIFADQSIQISLNLVQKILVKLESIAFLKLLNYGFETVIILVVFYFCPKLIRQCPRLIVVLKDLRNVVGLKELIEMGSRNFILCLALLHRLLQLLDKLINQMLRFYRNQTRQLLRELRLLIQFGYSNSLNEALTLKFWYFGWMGLLFSELSGVLLNKLVESFFGLHQFSISFLGGFYCLLFFENLYKFI